MNSFEVENAAKALLSDWIQVNDFKTMWTIEDFPYDSGVDENLTKPHCWKCVSVNQCWFKNEERKKPKHFDYGSYSFSEIARSIRGLYHPNCHCKEKSINVPKYDWIELIVKTDKIKNFFDKKLGWFHAWGYKNKDKQIFIETMKDLAKKAYRYGYYQKEKHKKYGFQINLFVSIPGANDKKGKFYDVKTSYIIFPNGKLRLITLVGGLQ